MIGETVSHYRILEKIGEGGMGQVYLAEDTSLERNVALKFLPPSLHADSVAQKRFLREAKSAAAIDHPFICHIHEVAQTGDGQDFIVMEYVEGQTLKDRLEEGKLPIKEALQLGSEIADALEKAHSLGVIHRDLKPSNIMVTPEGHVKVMDFGLAKRIKRDEGDLTSVLTREGTTLGTLAYMSPEQLRGNIVDSRSDIFSFGLILYEMLTGVHPFHTGTQAETVNAILSEHPSKLSRYAEDVSDLLQHTVEKMLAKDRDQRYQSIHEVRTNLRKQLKEAPVTPSTEQLSIVVLPFDNLSPDPDQEYFADGLTEEVISDLAKVRALRVISRTSAMRLKGTEKDLRTIGHDLNVRYVLEGSVRRAGNALRITAQLIDAPTDTHLWAEKYTGTLDDVFDIQEKVSRSIADALKVELTSEENTKISDRPIDNIEAYERYLRARYEIFQFKEQSLDRAIRYLEDGLDLVGENALLLSSLGHAYWHYFNIAANVQEEYLDKAKFYAKKVTELAPESSHAHGLFGVIAFFENNLKETVRHLKKAYEINPSDSYYLFLVLLMYFYCGKPRSMARILNRIQEVDPLSPFYYTFKALVECSEGRIGDALEAAREGYRANPEMPQSGLYYAYFLGCHRRLEEASSVLSRLVQGNPGTIFSTMGLAFKHAFEGDKQGVVESITPESEQKIKRDMEWSWLMADCCAWADVKAKALNFLERAVSSGFINYPLLSQIDPFLENLRGDPDFRDLMAEVRYRWEHFEA